MEKDQPTLSMTVFTSFEIIIMACGIRDRLIRLTEGNTSEFVSNCYTPGTEPISLSNIVSCGVEHALQIITVAPSIRLSDSPLCIKGETFFRGRRSHQR